MKLTDSKTETLNLRISAKLKEALRVASEREHRSMANMVEYLVLNYCEKNGIEENKMNVTFSVDQE